MRRLIIYLLLLICTSSYSQKQLSQQAANELVNKASAFLGYENNDKVRAALNKYITTYNRAGSAAAMANLRHDLKGRDDLLNILNRAVSSREYLLMTLTAMNVNPANVQEISDYFFQPTSAKQETVKETTVKDSSVKQAPPVPEVHTPIVWLPPTKKYFDGRKTFCDSTGKWYYTVTIIKSNIIFTKYPGQPQVKSVPAESSKALINGDNIVNIDNQPVNYKYENNILYEKGDADRWNRYKECASD